MNAVRPDIVKIASEHLAAMRAKHHGLTKEQWRCALLVAEGATMRDIAKDFGLHHGTVNHHIRIAMRVFGVANIIQLTHVMIALGAVQVVDFRPSRWR